VRDATTCGASIVNKNAVFVELRDIANQAIWAIVSIWMLLASVRHGSPHLFAAMFHNLFLSERLQPPNP
jgi:hypothetical protein